MPKVKYTSNKGQGDGTTRIILEGTSTEPERFVDQGGEIELTDKELASLRKRHNFSEVGGSDSQEGKSQESTDRTSESAGSKQTGSAGEKKS